MTVKLNGPQQGRQRSATAEDTELSITITQLDSANLDRVAAVSAGSDHFNSSLQRHSVADLLDWIAKQDHFVLGVEADTDTQLGEQAFIGLIVCHADEEDFVADSFILAEDYIGWGIEQEMVRAITDHALACGCGAVVLPITPSDRNQTVQRFYKCLGQDVQLLPSGKLEVAFASLALEQALSNAERLRACATAQNNADSPAFAIESTAPLP